MSSDTTLVLERRPGGLRLYLGGDLQFDTDDEAIYHERLAHPALLAARARFEGPLNLLVLGGGDGLLVRELLRHEGVASVRLIDYNPEVLALAGTELAPWNGSSLADNRVVVEVADVREALAKAGSFHAIFSDLTCSRHPGRLRPVHTRLVPERSARTWSPGASLPSTGSLRTRPPRRTGASTRPSARPDSPRSRAGRASPASPSWDMATGGSSSARTEPSRLLRWVRYPFHRACALSTDLGSWTASSFPGNRPTQRTTIRPASDVGRTLYEYLLDATAIEPGEAEETVCFLGFDDPFPPPEPATATVPSLKLKGWLDRQPGTGIDDLLMCVPLGHRIVTRELVMEWADHLMQVASTLDLRRLTSALLRRAAALPGRLVAELKRFRKFLSRGEDPVANFTTWGWRFFSVLMLVLVLAQTAMPTAVYAKGFGHSAFARTWNLLRRWRVLFPKLVRTVLGLEPADGPAAAPAPGTCPEVRGQ